VKMVATIIAGVVLALGGLTVVALGESSDRPSGRCNHAHPCPTGTVVATKTSARSAPCGTRVGQNPHTYAHVIWVIFENKGYSSIVGNTTARYLNKLIAQCGLATNYIAVTHPSLPDYIAMTSGSTQGITDDNGPQSHPLSADSIFSQLGTTGWRSLEESMRRIARPLTVGRMRFDTTLPPTTRTFTLPA